MAEGKPPYGDIHPMRAIFMIPTKPPPSFRDPDRWSPEFIDFVQKCLVKNPEQKVNRQFTTATRVHITSAARLYPPADDPGGPDDIAGELKRCKSWKSFIQTLFSLIVSFVVRMRTKASTPRLWFHPKTQLLSLQMIRRWLLLQQRQIPPLLTWNQI